MPSNLMRLLAATTALAALALLGSPAAALAKGPPSASDVYSEQVHSASGHHSAPPATSHRTSTSATTTTSQSTSPTTPLPPKVKHKVKSQGGKDAGLLAQVASQAGDERKLAAVGTTTQPGTLNAAFDLGTGPTILFAFVLATVLFLAVGGGLRSWRRRRGPSA
jgi:hypothetical protein